MRDMGFLRNAGAAPFSL